MPKPGPSARPHPSRQKLAAFLSDRLDPRAAKSVLHHLLGGCSACREAVAPLAEVLRRTEAALQDAAAGAAEHEFGRHRAWLLFRRELRRARDEAAARHGHRRPAPAHEIFATLQPRFERQGGEPAWLKCEEALAASWEQRHDDPGEMVHHAVMAKLLAKWIGPGTRGPAQLADLQARAHAALGNALRVADDTLTAEWELATARERARHGTGDPLLRAHLLDLTASLRVDQRRFAEAEACLRESHALYLAQGDRPRAGKALLKRALATGYDADPDEAEKLLIGARMLMAPTHDRRTYLAFLHSLVMVEIDRGEYEHARWLVHEARWLYAAAGGALYDLKLVWLEGRIAAGLGQAARAEQLFRDARTGFLARKLPYTAAVVATDLAALLLERGRTAEARALVLETLETFEVLNIQRDALMGVLLLAEAARQDRLTIETLKSAAAELQKAER